MVKDRLRRNYYWIIAAVVLLQLGICGGADNNLSALHMVPVTAHLQITRSVYALGFSLRSVISMIVSFFSGALFRRFGYKKVTLVTLLLYAVGYGMLSRMESTGTYFVALALLGVACTFACTIGASCIIGSWFHRHRGTVLGVVTAATGIGGSVLCIFQTDLMQSYSWRSSYLLCGICAMVMLFVVGLTVRDNPGDMGLVPYGDNAPAQNKKHRMPEEIPEGKDMKALYRTPAFYLMFACTFLSALAVYMVFTVIVPYLTDSGFSDSQAGGLQSLMLLLLSGVKALAGILCDRIGAKKVTLGCIVFCTVGICLLALGTSYGAAATAVVLYTVSLPLTTVLIPLLALPLFGYRAQIQYTGIFIAACSGGNMLGSLLTNLIYDTQSSYRPAFYLAAGICVLTFGLYLLLYRLIAKTGTTNGA